MGACCATVSDSAIDKYKENESEKYNLLCLGVTGTGKTTFCNQMRYIHSTPFEDNDSYIAKQHLFQNVSELMHLSAVYHQKNKLQINDKNIEIRDKIASLDINTLTITSSNIDQYRYDFLQLWKDSGFKKVVEFAYVYIDGIVSNVPYLCQNMEKLLNDKFIYLPTVKDLFSVSIPSKRLTKIPNITEFDKISINSNILVFGFIRECEKCEIIPLDIYKLCTIYFDRNIGTNEYELRISKNFFGTREEIWTLFDTGSSNMSCMEWLQLFNNQTHDSTECDIIYFVSLSDYTNVVRFQESLDVFGDIINSDYGKRLHWILFFNKCDLFETMISNYSVSTYWPEFEGSNDSREEILNFFKQKFKDKRILLENLDIKTDIHFHVTCATDTVCCKKMFESIRHIVAKHWC